MSRNTWMRFLAALILQGIGTYMYERWGPVAGTPLIIISLFVWRRFDERTVRV